MNQNKSTPNITAQLLFKSRLQEALVKSFLAFEGFAVIRDDRMLTVYSKQDCYSIFLHGNSSDLFICDLYAKIGGRGACSMHTSLKMTEKEFDSLIEEALTTVKGKILQGGLIRFIRVERGGKNENILHNL